MRSRVVCFFLIAAALEAQTPSWTQFRGQNATGIAEGSRPVPIEFGPAKNQLWKTPLPSGYSSPVVYGDRIFLTGFDQGKLEVLCLRRSNGQIVWRRPVPAAQIEKVHAVSNPANATPVVDEKQVYVYFGSYGLMSFDHDGKELWTIPLPLPETRFGSGTSPVLVGEMLILNGDRVKDPFLLAVDRRSGKTIWKQTMSQTGRIAESYSTPVANGSEVVLHRSGRIEAFDIKTGTVKWWLTAPTTGTATPVVGKDALYVATWFPFGEADQILPLPDFASLLKNDKNEDGRIQQDEFPGDVAFAHRPGVSSTVTGSTIYVKGFFAGIDPNKDGSIEASEWEGIRKMLGSLAQDHGLIALKLTGEGDVRATNILWQEKTGIPEVPSPLSDGKRLYMVRNGGILTCLDSATGKVLYRSRIGSPGAYYASPVKFGSTIYLASAEGVVTAIKEGDTLSVLARNDLGEPIFATPAITDGKIYVRTSGHLFAFGEPAK